jgi:phage gpG-like protein
MANIIANVKITGLKEMIDKLRRQGVNINEGLRNAVADAAAMAVNTITELAPHKTGRLARSINAKFQDNGLTARIGTNVKYAAIQEFGGFVRAKYFIYMTFPLNSYA